MKNFTKYFKAIEIHRKCLPLLLQAYDLKSHLFYRKKETATQSLTSPTSHYPDFSPPPRPQQPQPQAGGWWLFFFILMHKLVALILQHVVLCVAINV